MLSVHEIVRHSPVGIAVIDGAGRYRSVNPAYAAMYGYASSDMPGLSFTVVFDEGVRGQMLARHQAFIADGRELRGEYEVRRRDGSHLTIIAESIRIADETGEPCRLVYVTDVSELKRTQEALRQREAALDDIAASMPATMFRMLTRRDGSRRTTYISPNVVRWFDVRPEDLMGQERPLAQAVLPEDRPAFEASLHEAISRRVRWAHDCRVRTRGGRVLWVHGEADPKDGVGEEVVWTGMLSDITERKRIEAELRDSEATFRNLFETVPLGVVYQASDGQITAANPAAQRILGLSLEQLQGRTSVDPRWKAQRADGSPFPGEEHPSMVALRTGQPVRDVVMGVARSDDTQVWILVNAVPQFRQGRLSEVYATFEDITERRRLEQELRQQAATDFLTGVANRRSFMSRLGEEFERVRRHPEASSCLLTLDLDHFKRVNDTHGHAVGDAVLCHVVQVLLHHSRRIDVLGRTGGEEFALLLPDTGEAEALRLAERLREAVQAAPVDHQGAAIAMTVSIGASRIAPDDASAGLALWRADEALYRAKRLGRNAVQSQWPGQGTEPAAGPDGLRA